MRQTIGQQACKGLRQESQQVVNQDGAQTHTVTISPKAVAINPSQQKQAAHAQPIHKEMLNTTDTYQPYILHLNGKFVAKVRTISQTANYFEVKSQQIEEFLCHSGRNVYFCTVIR